MNTTMTMQAGYYTATQATGTQYKTAIAKAKYVAMIVAAPLIGLAAVTLLPLAGLATLVWMGFKALPKIGRAHV